VTQLVRHAEKALRMIEGSEKHGLDDDYKESLELEFLELARIYDRFFLVLSVLATVATSVGILMSSPFSSGNH
jgi:hypothetical protein